MLNPYVSEKINVKHGFYGRCGGKSTGVLKGLNVGLNKDDPHATENRKLIAKDFSTGSIYTPQQTHSNIVHILDDIPELPLTGDAYVSNKKGICIGVRTADCVPILFHDPISNIIGAIHAGWKGAVSDIVKNTVAAFKSLGTQKSKDITAAIGPCIWQDSYEVQQDFLDNFSESEQESFFKRREGRIYFDLPGFVTYKLKEEGISNIIHSPFNTYENPERYFSYRRFCHNNDSIYGVQFSGIML